MKTKLLLTLALIIGVITMTTAQLTTGIVNLSGSTRTLQIDTDATTVTMTLTGSSTAWLGLGFGGTSMSSVTDMFIWNATANRDYIAPGGHNTPSPDAVGSQSWTIVSDVISGVTRTVVATRALISAGDFTFLNNATAIPIIFAEGSTTTLAYHGSNPHAAQSLSRTALGLEDFSLKAAQIYPNPTTGEFVVKTKSHLEKINVYSLTGSLIKTFEVKDNSENVEVNINKMQTGVYLLELVNGKEKTWKKIIVAN